MYKVDETEWLKRPEIRIGNKVFEVDNRLSTFEALNDRLKDCESGKEFDIIVGKALGEKAREEILSLDISVGAMQKIVILILAAIQGITEAEAEARFRN